MAGVSRKLRRLRNQLIKPFVVRQDFLALEMNRSPSVYTLSGKFNECKPLRMRNISF